MDTILANTSRKFTVQDKVYTVKALNMFQLASIRQKLIDMVKSTYKTDIIDLANAVPEKDRSKFIFDALKAKSYSEEELNTLMTSSLGVNLILSMALHEPIEFITKLINDQIDNEILVDIFNFVLQIDGAPVEKKVDSTTMT